jgi:PhnB protein
MGATDGRKEHSVDFVPYLGFNGTCREAFSFYADLFGGAIEAMLTHGEMPDADNHVDAADRAKIMHAALRVGDGLLYGGDAPGNYYTTPAGFMVTLTFADAGEGERVFNALAEGGKVQMPYGETFWTERFGMAIDRFGTPWAINGGQTKS